MHVVLPAFVTRLGAIIVRGVLIYLLQNDARYSERQRGYFIVQECPMKEKSNYYVNLLVVICLLSHVTLALFGIVTR